MPRQRSLRCRLDEVPQLIAEHHLRPPVVAIVGGAAADGAAEALNWFETRPLFGRRILVTRPAGQAAALTRPLQDWGADVQTYAAIEIGPPPDPQALQAAIGRLREYDWVVFSSRNGVQAVIETLMESADLRQLGNCRLAVIGPATATALEEHHLRADCQPESFVAEALAAELTPRVRDQRVLLIRASRGRDVLAKTLTASAAVVDQVVAYSSRDAPPPSDQLRQSMAAGEFDWVTVTSSAIATSLIRGFGEALRETQLVSISPITSATLRDHGFEPAAEATDATMESVRRALRAREEKGVRRE